MSDRLIMAVEREFLLGGMYASKHFEGFKPNSEFDYENLILQTFSWVWKEPAEKDPTYKQPIGYVAIVNSDTKKIFLYHRNNGLAYDEARLRGKISIGVGGHIEKTDTKNMTGINPIVASRKRELEEEIELTDIKSIDKIGYINDDADDVGKVHFGILYVLETGAHIVKPKSDELSTGSMIDICDAVDIIKSSENVEGWTKIAIDPIYAYVSEKFGRK